MAEHGFLVGQQTATTYTKPLGRDWKKVTYAVVGDRAVFEGCIILGSVAEMQTVSKTVEEQPALLTPGAQHFGAAIKGVQFRWKNRRVPYLIAPDLPNQERVQEAIAHWHAKTSFKFEPRKEDDVDYVVFRPGDGCASSVGRRGGMQEVILGAGCTAGNCIHELGHTVGLWHEQSRADRDEFIEIRTQHIIPNTLHNFLQHIIDGVDLGDYDYGSIMHYPKNAFSADGSDTILPKEPGTVIGQREGLSPGDIAAIEKL
jgi:hypothetical protein